MFGLRLRQWTLLNSGGTPIMIAFTERGEFVHVGAAWLLFVPVVRSILLALARITHCESRTGPRHDISFLHEATCRNNRHSLFFDSRILGRWRLTTYKACLQGRREKDNPGPIQALHLIDRQTVDSRLKQDQNRVNLNRPASFVSKFKTATRRKAASDMRVPNQQAVALADRLLNEDPAFSNELWEH